MVDELQPGRPGGNLINQEQMAALRAFNERKWQRRKEEERKRQKEREREDRLQAWAKEEQKKREEKASG